MGSDSLGVEAQRQVSGKLPGDSSGQPRSIATNPEGERRQVELLDGNRKNIGGGNYDDSLVAVFCKSYKSDARGSMFYGGSADTFSFRG